MLLQIPPPVEKGKPGQDMNKKAGVLQKFKGAHRKSKKGHRVTSETRSENVLWLSNWGLSHKHSLWQPSYHDVRKPGPLERPLFHLFIFKGFI